VQVDRQVGRLRLRPQRLQRTGGEHLVDGAAVEGERGQAGRGGEHPPVLGEGGGEAAERGQRGEQVAEPQRAQRQQHRTAHPASVPVRRAASAISAVVERPSRWGSTTAVPPQPASSAASGSSASE
jgi:hypothetical protein